MQTNGKSNIRNRLKKLLIQVKSIKSSISQLRLLHQNFTFASILSQKNVKPKIMRALTDSNEEDKQNNFNQINRNITKSRELNKAKQAKQSLKLMPRHMFADENLQSLKSKNEQIKNLKAGLVMQLSQIKSMEKKSQSMRRANQKIKEYNSNQKRSYRQSLQKSKQNFSVENSNISEKTIISHSSNQLESLILESKISLQVPSQCEEKIKILKCEKGHEFYEGSVNNLDQPHGNGRLQICCSAISSSIGNQYVKDSLFYQGQFKNGKFHGFGTLSYRGGVKYVGQFKQGKRQGKGSMYYNGKAEVATWQNDNFISIM